MSTDDPQRHDGPARPGPRLILILALLAGVGAGVLACLGGQPWPIAILAAGGGTAAAVDFFDRLLTAGRPAPPPDRRHDGAGKGR